MVVGPLTEVIVHAKDMNAQVAFYRDKLGLTVTYPAGRSDYASDAWVTFDTGACTLALHDGRPDHAPPVVRFTFGVSDIRAAREELLGRGVEIGEVRSPAPGVLVVDGKDPEGNVFALEHHQ